MNVKVVNELMDLPPVAGAEGTVTIADTALTLSAQIAVPEGRNPQLLYLRMQVDGADIRMTMGGTTPVAATTGFLVVDGSWMTFRGTNYGVVKVIRNAGVSATLRYCWLTR
jgi:hypothetical protein